MVTESSAVEGIHLDELQHEALGKTVAKQCPNKGVLGWIFSRGVGAGEVFQRNRVEAGPASPLGCFSAFTGFPMLIRKMGPEDIPEVSAMVVESFSHSVAGDLSDEGVATFMELSSPEAFRRRMQEDNCMLVHEEAGEIMGMVELKEGRHVAMLFVAPGKQRHGVGRGLVREVLKHRRTHCVTVSASISSVPAYESFGFRATGPEKESEGLRYVPMSIECGEKVSLI